MRAHLKVHAETLDFEVAEFNAFGAVGSAEQDAYRRGPIPWTGQSQVAHAVSHTVPHAVVECNGGPGTGESEVHHVAWNAAQENRLAGSFEGNRRGEGTGFVHYDGAARRRQRRIGGINLFADVAAEPGRVLD